MSSIPGIWDLGPHQPLAIEETWQRFVVRTGGNLVSELLPPGLSIENADFIFPNVGVIAELKEIQTEFSRSEKFTNDFSRLMERLLKEDPDWRPTLLGGDGLVPNWFQRDYVRIFRPNISRILKKANRQLRETKRHFGIGTPTGVLFLVNDEFTSVEPQMILALAAHILTSTYSSIDCLVYLTVNRYIAVQFSNIPRLLWVPAYSHRAPDSLVAFIDDLGRKWFDFLEETIGPFTDRTEVPSGSSKAGNILKRARSIP